MPARVAPMCLLYFAGKIADEALVEVLCINHEQLLSLEPFRPLLHERREVIEVVVTAVRLLVRMRRQHLYLLLGVSCGFRTALVLPSIEQPRALRGGGGSGSAPLSL